MKTSRVGKILGVFLFLSNSLLADLTSTGFETLKHSRDYFPLCLKPLMRKIPSGYAATSQDWEVRTARNPQGVEVRLRWIQDEDDRNAHVSVFRRLAPLMRDPQKVGFALASLRAVPQTQYLEWPVVPGVAAWEAAETYRRNLRKFAAILREHFATVESDLEKDPMIWSVALSNKETGRFVAQLIITPNPEHVVYDPQSGLMTLILDAVHTAEPWDDEE